MSVEDMFKKDPSEITLGEAVENPVGEPAKEDAAPTPEGDEVALAEKVAPSTNKRFKELLERIEDKETEISELKRFKQEVESGKYSQQSNESIPQEWVELFGENAKKAWEVNFSLLTKMEERLAKKLEEQQALKQQAADQETRKWESHIEKQLIELEDSKGIDVTSDTPQAKKLRSDLKQIIEDFSPEGTMIPFTKAYEILELKKGKTPSSTPAKKEIAARSMSRSAGSVIEPTEVGTGSWREKYFPGQ